MSTLPSLASTSLSLLHLVALASLRLQALLVVIFIVLLCVASFTEQLGAVLFFPLFGARHLVLSYFGSLALLFFATWAWRRGWRFRHLVPIAAGVFGLVVWAVEAQATLWWQVLVGLYFPAVFLVSAFTIPWTLERQLPILAATGPRITRISIWAALIFVTATVLVLAMALVPIPRFDASIVEVHVATLLGTDAGLGLLLRPALTVFGVHVSLLVVRLYGGRRQTGLGTQVGAALVFVILGGLIFWAWLWAFPGWYLGPNPTYLGLEAWFFLALLVSWIGVNAWMLLAERAWAALHREYLEQSDLHTG